MDKQSVKLILRRETIQKLEAPAEGKADPKKGFLTRLGCYTPFSCPVPCY